MDELVTRAVQILCGAELSARVGMPDGTMPRVVQPLLVAALKTAECVSGAAYEYYGERERDGSVVSVYGRHMTATIGVTVLAPTEGAVCETVQRALTALYGGIPGAALRRITVGKTAYSAAEDAFRCEMGLEVQACLFAETEEDEPEFLSFRLEGRME